MAGKKIDIDDIPSVELIEKELARGKYRHRYRRTLASTIYGLVTVAAAAVLIAFLWLPVLTINGSSMSPLLNEGDVAVTRKNAEFDTGSVVAFYYNNNILIKRVIAGPGDIVNIDENGNVYVNDAAIDEPYVSDRALGHCNIELPFEVPDEKYFVMGDHRTVSIDSRNTAVGCIGEEQIVGKVIFRIWPFPAWGKIESA